MESVRKNLNRRAAGDRQAHEPNLLSETELLRQQIRQLPRIQHPTDVGYRLLCVYRHLSEWLLEPYVSRFAARPQCHRETEAFTGESVSRRAQWHMCSRLESKY